MRPRWWLVLLVVLFAPRNGLTEPTGRWIVVTAPAYRAAIEPLCQQRQSQGLKVTVVLTSDVLAPNEILSGESRKLRERVHQLCRGSREPSYVLLVGAVEPGNLSDADKKVLPPLRGTVGRMKGQLSDNGYGCLDDGELPTLAVGRFPARSEDEVRGMVEKTLVFERDTRPGAWRRRLTMLLGNPGGDSAFQKALAERYVEGSCLARAGRLHPCWTTRSILHCPQSSFCVPDHQLHERALQYLKEGQVFTLYAGHSGPEGFWSEGVRFLDRDDWAKLKLGGGPGVLVSCGCFGCQQCGAEGEGYGQAAIRNPAGPAAVVGSHGESYAAMGQLAFDGLLQSFATPDLPARLGECWLGLKAGIAKAPMDGITFTMLDMADGSRGDTPLALQRREHLEMWLLLGDPALRLPVLPQDVRLTVEGKAVPGQMLTVMGTTPERLAGARVRITLERPSGSLPTDLPSLPAEPKERERALLARHELANRYELTEAEATVVEGRFEARLQVPVKWSGPRLIVRAYAHSERQEGLGVVALPK
jgi:hypothetical protein